jgi:Domain of unknown function (DUF397)
MEDWRTSSHSTGDGGQCVEVASAETVMVRDSSNRDGGMLVFAVEAWKQFTDSLK